MITIKPTLSYFQVLCNGPEDMFQEEEGLRVMQGWITYTSRGAQALTWKASELKRSNMIMATVVIRSQTTSLFLHVCFSKFPIVPMSDA